MVGAERGISPAIWDLAWLLSSGTLEMCSLTSYSRGFSEKGVVLMGVVLMAPELYNWLAHCIYQQKGHAS